MVSASAHNFDSWFSWRKVIKEVKSRQVDVICMLKDMKYVTYGYRGHNYRLRDLYSVLAKSKGKSDINDPSF